jgi:hypothetical protein
MMAIPVDEYLAFGPAGMDFAMTLHNADAIIARKTRP